MAFLSKISALLIFSSFLLTLYSYFFNDDLLIEHKTVFLGIRCMWFTETKELKEAVFNTKDLEKIY